MPLEFGDENWRQKTRIMRLPCGAEIMIVGRTVWAQSTSVTEGTDRHADRFSMKCSGFKMGCSGTAMHSAAR